MPLPAIRPLPIRFISVPPRPAFAVAAETGLGQVRAATNALPDLHRLDPRLRNPQPSGTRHGSLPPSAPLAVALLGPAREPLGRAPGKVLELLGGHPGLGVLSGFRAAQLRAHEGLLRS